MVKKTIQKKITKKIEKTAKINIKFPHMNKKSLAKKKNFV